MKSDGKKQQEVDAHDSEKAQQRPQQQQQSSTGTGEGASSAYARMRSLNEQKAQREPAEERTRDAARP